MRSKGSRGARGVRLSPKHDERTRAKIRTTQVIKRLERFVLEEKDENGVVVVMSAQQVTAALGLLRKTLPDLTSTEHSGEIEVKHDATEYTDDELAAIVARASGLGNAETAGRAKKPNKLH